MSAFGFGDLAFVGAVGGSQLWTPAQIATALWLDAADSSTITTVGGAVSQWNDKSGKNVNAVTDTISRRPTYSLNSQNGNNAVTFGGTQNLIFTEALVSGLKFSTTSFEGFAAVNPTSFSTAVSIIFGARGFAAGWMFGFSSNAPFVRLFSASDLWLPAPMSNIATVTEPQIFYFSAPRGGTGQYRKNDNLLQSTTSLVGTSSIFQNTVNMRIGSYANDQNVATGFFQGSIYELIIVGPTLLSDENRQKTHGYLAHKWGLTAGLPSDHPYKSFPPII